MKTPVCGSRRSGQSGSAAVVNSAESDGACLGEPLAEAALVPDRQKMCKGIVGHGLAAAAVVQLVNDEVRCGKGLEGHYIVAVRHVRRLAAEGLMPLRQDPRLGRLWAGWAV